jgi:hypothetical protein
MSLGELGTLVVVVLGLGALVFVIGSMIRSMRNEHRAGHSIWKQFGLGIALMILFFATWAGQGIAEWQTYTDDQHAHGDSAEVGDFISTFAQSTLENWQSEFLQLLWQVVGLAYFLYIGSPSSKENDDRLDHFYLREHGHAQPLDHQR